MRVLNPVGGTGPCSRNSGRCGTVYPPQAPCWPADAPYSHRGRCLSAPVNPTRDSYGLCMAIHTVPVEFKSAFLAATGSPKRSSGGQRTSTCRLPNERLKRNGIAHISVAFTKHKRKQAHIASALARHSIEPRKNGLVAPGAPVLSYRGRISDF